MFYLGTHQIDWLWRVPVPLFVSDIRLRRRRRLSPRRERWALDSGGFSELSRHGRWREGGAAYAARVAGYVAALGAPDFAAPQDWMCEPQILEQTGLTIDEHQRRTVASFLELTAERPTVPWMPVLQGWAEADYLRHLDAYAAAGVDLRARPVVGVGTICRRQATPEAERVVRRIIAEGVRVHAFGFKKSGLAAVGHLVHSADSMAWSYNARRNPPMAGCSHRNCANCPRWAMRWREDLLRNASPAQSDLFGRSVAA